jgi:predicted metal-binding protein
MEQSLKTDDLSESGIAPGNGNGCREHAGHFPAVTIVICQTCRRGEGQDGDLRPGARLAESARRAASATAIAVKEVACLGNCRRGLSAALLRPGAWNYVFGDLDEKSGTDLVAAALLLQHSADGFLPYGSRPESLKRGLIARIPPVGFPEDKT